MYYIIESTYVGPNSSHNAESDSIVISTTPAITNSSHEARISGWCGTNNDWATYAHGEYPTLDAACAAVAEQFGDVHDGPESDDPDIVAVYLPGRYVSMSRRETEDWIHDGMVDDIDADTTDREIDALAVEYENAANDQGIALHAALRDIMTEYRDYLRSGEDDDA